MTVLQVSVLDQTLSFDTSSGIDISIPQTFGNSQPSHFDAPRATQKPLETGGFVGDTKGGGSCNVSVITMVPHCNGTHTECLSHITDQGPTIRDMAPNHPQLAILTTIEPVSAAASKDDCKPEPEPQDMLITESAIRQALASNTNWGVSALIVRTLPNSVDKQTRDYEETPPPYFSLNAIKALVDSGIDHLLVDTPSIDRSHDQGKLNGHRAFWGLPDGSRNDLEAKRPWATITELVFVDNDLHDGLYLLSLQVPPFCTDAAPSRPILFELNP